MSYLLTTIGPLIEWVLQPSRLHGTPTKIFIGYLWVDYGLHWSINFLSIVAQIFGDFRG